MFQALPYCVVLVRAPQGGLPLTALVLTQVWPWPYFDLMRLDFAFHGKTKLSLRECAEQSEPRKAAMNTVDP